jgi:motility quorum-sensing regulator/GCU-specific mRNA interferase toxin
VEKRRPHYELRLIKAALCDVPSLQMTATALQCALTLNLTLEDVIECIQTTTRGHFFKSMTARANSSIWQDVYRPCFRGLLLYVKFTSGPQGLFVVSFKER